MGHLILCTTSTVVPLLVAPLNRGYALKWGHEFFTLLLGMHLLLPLAKGHLSNVATISWQLGRPVIWGGLLYIHVL